MIVKLNFSCSNHVSLYFSPLCLRRQGVLTASPYVMMLTGIIPIFNEFITLACFTINCDCNYIMLLIHKFNKIMSLGASREVQDDIRSPLSSSQRTTLTR